MSCEVSRNVMLSKRSSRTSPRCASSVMEDVEARELPVGVGIEHRAHERRGGVRREHLEELGSTVTKRSFCASSSYTTMTPTLAPRCASGGMRQASRARVRRLSLLDVRHPGEERRARARRAPPSAVSPRSPTWMRGEGRAPSRRRRSGTSAGASSRRRSRPRASARRRAAPAAPAGAARRAGAERRSGAGSSRRRGSRGSRAPLRSRA